EDITIVEIEEEKILKMAEDYPAYFPTTVPSDTYDGMEEDVETIGVNNVLITHNDVPDEVVYEMTKGLFENISRMQDSHHAANDIDIEDAVDNLPTPLHPGAEKFYKEEGVEEERSEERRVGKECRSRWSRAH